jgi:hypothetical protein
MVTRPLVEMPDRTSGMADGLSDFRFGLVLTAEPPAGGNADIAGTWAVRPP